jgi:hypothetical protein
MQMRTFKQMGCRNKENFSDWLRDGTAVDLLYWRYSPIQLDLIWHMDTCPQHQVQLTSPLADRPA